MRKLILTLLIATCSSGVWPLFATAQSVYKWTDENGRVHYSDHPITTDTTRVRTQANTLEACDATCQQRLSDDKFQARLEEELRNVPKGECSAKYYAINETSKKLAHAAVEECKLNYAMQRIDPNYVPKTGARDRHKQFSRDFSQKAAQVQQAAKLEQMRQEQAAKLEQIRQEQAARAAEQQRQLRSIERSVDAPDNVPNEITLRKGVSSTKCRKSIGTTYNCD